MLRKVFDILFWLAVAVYFGGMITVGAIVAPAVFSSAHDAHLSMPGIVSPPLEVDRQVGGEVFGVILNRFAYVEYAALGVILVAIIGWFRTQRPASYTTWVVMLLWLGLAGLVAYDALEVRPLVFKQRQLVRDTAAAHVTVAPASAVPATTSSPATAPLETMAAATTSAPVALVTAVPVATSSAPWPERDKFDALHKTSEDLGHYKVYLLLGMILVAGFYGSSPASAPDAAPEPEPEPERPAPRARPIKKRRPEPLDP